MIQTKTLNKNTKKAQNYIYNFETSRTYNLRQAYKTRASEEKERVFEKYLKECDSLGGYSFKITSFCRFYVSFGFLVDEGEKTFLYYITPSQDYKIEL